MSEPTTVSMSDPTLCRGREADGSQCICMRCTETYVQDGTNRILCTSCGHIESAHPAPAISAGSLIRSYKDLGRLSVPSKASKEEAEAEASSGLRKKRKSDTDTEPGSKRAKADKGKGKVSLNQPLLFPSFITLLQEEKSSKNPARLSPKDHVAYGKLVFLGCGITRVSPYPLPLNVF